MNETPARSLRVRPEEVLARILHGETIRFLDVRSQKALEETTLQIPGSTRFNALLIPIDPDWDRQILTVVYCT